MRKMSYMRAIVRGTREAVDLESIVRSLMEGKDFPLKIINDDRVIEAMQVPDLGDFGGVALHLVTYQEDTHEILIDHDNDALETLPPPAGSDFVRARLFAIVTDCHVVALPVHPARNSLAIHFARGLDVGPLTQEQVNELKQVTLVKPPAEDMLEMIEDIGVKEIKLDWSIPASHLAEKLQAQAAKPLGIFKSFFLEADNDADAVHAEGELVFETRLRPKTRRGEVRQTELAQEKKMAEAIVKDEDGYGYVITLKNGTHLTPETMDVSKTQTFDEDQPGMISPEEAFAALLEYHQELKDNGAFD